MAKRSNAPPAPKFDEMDMLLIELASTIIADHFFDPDNEDSYKAQLSAAKSSGTNEVLLYRDSFDASDGSCVVSLEGLKTWTSFRVTMQGDTFKAVIVGDWSFDHEELRKARVTERSGDEEAMLTAIEEIIDEFEGLDLDDEELNGLSDLLAEDSEEEAELPDFSDDPVEPPPATGLDKSRVKAIARRLARSDFTGPNDEDRTWLELTPQTLPVIIDGFVEAVTTGDRRDDGIVLAYRHLLALQLEFVRYRQDRGWPWAIEMLEAFQQRLVAIAQAGTMSQEDWFAMASTLTDARVPVSDMMQTQLGLAGLADESAGPPDKLVAALQEMLDSLAEMADSPFDVVEALHESDAVMPAALRGFMATELSLSPHQVLRDTVPMMLLDDESEVRRMAAHALEQTARPDTLSSDALRRCIAMRNWVPPDDRPAIDSTIRAARRAGVAPGAWPPNTADLEFYASMIDGSGAQSILTVSKTGRKGVFGGVLCRHGVGVVDAWIDDDVPRSRVTKLLKDATTATCFTRVERGYVDEVVQHAIATGARTGSMPPPGLLVVAEQLGGVDWQDRALDVAVEAEQLYQSLPEKDRAADAVYARGLGWMEDDEVMSSWFEDGPSVMEALRVAPKNVDGRRAAILDKVIGAKRGEWAEKFLLAALWSRASQETKFRGRAPELILTAKALAGAEPLSAIPVMAPIADRTLAAAIAGHW